MCVNRYLLLWGPGSYPDCIIEPRRFTCTDKLWSQESVWMLTYQVPVGHRCRTAILSRDPFSILRQYPEGDDISFLLFLLGGDIPSPILQRRNLGIKFFDLPKNSENRKWGAGIQSGI